LSTKFSREYSTTDCETTYVHHVSSTTTVAAKVFQILKLRRRIKRRCMAIAHEQIKQDQK
jgi:glyceraldehyde-3-phosphate dehydrogenase/erythrose-4-phosphate dehydrogenase